MNVFGRLAEFIWDYQEEIQIAFIIIVIAAAIYVVARMVRASRKKRELLSQINDTVTQINTAVSSISDKQSGVVYIDNRVGADARLRAIEAIENTVRRDPCGPSREGKTPRRQQTRPSKGVRPRIPTVRRLRLLILPRPRPRTEQSR